VLVYDTATSVWSCPSKHAPWAARAFHTATLVPADPSVPGDDDELFLIGGSDAQRVHGDVWCCNLRTWAWRPVKVASPGADALKRVAHGATLHPKIKRCILVHGGCALVAVGGAYRGDLLRVDLRTDTAVVTLMQTAAPPVARGYHVMCGLSTFALVFGGRVDVESQREVVRAKDAAALYDALADRWRTDARPAGVEPPSRCSAAACPLYSPTSGATDAAASLGVLVHGGRGPSSRFNDTIVLRVGAVAGTFAWEALGEACQADTRPIPPRNMHAMAAVPVARGPDGAPGWHVLMCGGFLDADKCTADCYVKWLPLHTVQPDIRAAMQASVVPTLAAPLAPPSQPGGGAGSQGVAVEEASQWHAAKPKRLRTHAETQPQPAPVASRRGDLGLAPVAEVRAREELEAAKARAERVEAELLDVRRQLQEAKQRLDDMERQAASDRNLVEAAQRDAKATRGLADAAQKSAAMAKAEAAAATREKHEAISRAVEAEADKRALVVAVESERAQMQQELHTARQQVSAEQSAAARQKQEVDDLHARLRVADAATAEQRKMAGQQGDELNRARSELMLSRTRIEDLELRMKSLDSEKAQLKSNAELDAASWRSRLDKSSHDANEALTAKMRAETQTAIARQQLHAAEQREAAWQSIKARVLQAEQAHVMTIHQLFASGDPGGGALGNGVSASGAAADWGRL
jgi:cell division protein FtsL